MVPLRQKRMRDNFEVHESQLVKESKARCTISKRCKHSTLSGRCSSSAVELLIVRQDLVLADIMGSFCDDCCVRMRRLTFAVISLLGGISVVRTYSVVRKLGGGNFGSVFEVQDIDAEAGKTLACKQIKRTKQGDEDFNQV